MLVLTMSEIQTISIAVASSGVFIAAIYYILQIRHQTRSRQTDLVMRLYATFSSNEFQDAWAKVRAKASVFESIDTFMTLTRKLGFEK